MTAPFDDTTPEISCLKCGYNLTHLPPGDCPECGKAFDPNDLRTINRIRSNKSTVLNISYHAFIWMWVIASFGGIAIGLIVLFTAAIHWIMDQ